MKPPKIKPCRICGEPVTPRRRIDRPGSYHYPKQCEKCFDVRQNPDLWKQRTSAKMKGMQHPGSLPMFTERIVRSGELKADGSPRQYVTIKVTPSGQWPFKHRWMMEQHLGRKLKSSEVVHHIDGNTLNNDLSNLKILSNICHSQLHNVINTWSEEHDCCVFCGTTDKPHKGHGLCVNCWQRSYHANKRP